MIVEKPTAALVPAHCKGVNKHLGPEFQLWIKTRKFDKFHKVGYSKIQKVIKITVKNMSQKNFS